MDLAKLVKDEVQRLVDDVLDTDYQPVLVEMVRDLRVLHGQYWDASKDPNGTPWPPLAAATVRYKGHDTILVDTEALLTSVTRATGDSILTLTGSKRNHEVTMGTTVEYARYHMTGTRNKNGTRRMPARPFMGVNDAVANAMADRVADFTIRDVIKRGSKVTLTISRGV
jgi:phage gpG-like protein